MSTKEYMILYSMVYNYCTNIKNVTHLGDANGNVVKKPKKTAGGAKLVGQELYSKINDYFKNYQKQLLVVSFISEGIV